MSAGRREKMYIPEFVCGIIVGAVGMFALIVAAALISDRKRKR